MVLACSVESFKVKGRATISIVKSGNMAAHPAANEGFIYGIYVTIGYQF
jgi:hypothetical protein